MLYRKTLSEIYEEIMRDGVSESNRPLFSAPSIMLISIAARLMEEGVVSVPHSLSFSLACEQSRWERDVLSALGRPCIMHSTCNYCKSILGRFRSRSRRSRPRRRRSRTRSRFNSTLNHAKRRRANATINLSRRE